MSNRDIILRVRLTEAEKKRLETAAETDKKTMSEFMRQFIPEDKDSTANSEA